MAVWGRDAGGGGDSILCLRDPRNKLCLGIPLCGMRATGIMNSTSRMAMFSPFSIRAEKVRAEKDEEGEEGEGGEGGEGRERIAAGGEGADTGAGSRQKRNAAGCIIMLARRTSSRGSCFPGFE